MKIIRVYEKLIAWKVFFMQFSDRSERFRNVRHTMRFLGCLFVLLLIKKSRLFVSIFFNTTSPLFFEQSIQLKHKYIYKPTRLVFGQLNMKAARPDPFPHHR